MAVDLLGRFVCPQRTGRERWDAGQRFAYSDRRWGGMGGFGGRRWSGGLRIAALRSLEASDRHSRKGCWVPCSRAHA